MKRLAEVLAILTAVVILVSALLPLASSIGFVIPTEPQPNVGWNTKDSASLLGCPGQRVGWNTGPALTESGCLQPNVGWNTKEGAFLPGVDQTTAFILPHMTPNVGWNT